MGSDAGRGVFAVNSESDREAYRDFSLAAYLLPVPWCALNRLYAWAFGFTIIWLAGYVLSAATSWSADTLRVFVFYFAYVSEKVIRMWFARWGRAIARRREDQRRSTTTRALPANETWLIAAGLGWWSVGQVVSVYLILTLPEYRDALLAVSIDVIFLIAATLLWRSGRIRHVAER